MGETEGDLVTFSASLRNKGLGGSGCETAEPKDGGKGRSCCMAAAIKSCGGIPAVGLGVPVLCT